MPQSNNMNTQIENSDLNAIFDKDQDTNEDECFQCGKAGKLYCCDFCLKSFHNECNKLKKREGSNLWECFYCDSQRCCQFCKESAFSSSYSLCTICHLASHKHCILQYQRIPQSTMNQTSLKGETYVCKGCLKKFGFSSIVKCKLVEEQLIVLVQINYKSPMHYGYFKEKDIQQVFQLKIKERSKGKTRQNVFPVKSSQEFKLQKILQIRVPKQFQLLGCQSIMKMLFREQVYHGKKENFVFLVKWEGISYEYCTWEDQYTIRMLDQQRYHLHNFIKNRQAGKKSSLKELIFPKDLHMNNLLKQQKIVKMAKFNALFGLQIIEEVKDQVQRISAQVCAFLNYTYLVQNKREVSIIIVTKNHSLLWSNKLNQKCQQLNVITFHCSTKSQQLIKQKEVGKFKHQVILMTFQFAIKNLEYFQNKIKKIAFAFVQNYSFCGDKLKNFLKTMTLNLIAMQDSKWTKNQLVKLGESYQSHYIFKHNMDWNSVQVIPPQVSPYDPNLAKRIVKMVSIRQQKRLAIIRFILRFGLQASSCQQFYELLHKFEPQVFDLPTLNQQNALLFKSYVTSLMILISLHNQFELEPKIRQYYFSIVNPAHLFKRIANLHCLRQFANDASGLLVKDSQMRNNKGKVLGVFSAWKKDDDVILVNLILQHGYDNWKQIFDSHSWKKYSQLSKLFESNRLNFMDYVRMKCVVHFKGSMGNIEEFIINRVQAIIQAYEK